MTPLIIAWLIATCAIAALAEVLFDIGGRRR